MLSRIVNAVRQSAQLQLFSSDMKEDQLLKKMETENFALILAPWDLYRGWSRVEAFYGLTRNSGPTFAGYFCEPMPPSDLGQPPPYMRSILLDFANLGTREAVKLLECLIKDSERTGIRPLLDPVHPIYCENWYSGQGMGMRFDSVMALPEIAHSDWRLRSGCIRLILGALWGLIYEEGPGKSELTQAITGSKSPRAYFQVGSDRLSLVFRLCYTMPGWAGKEAINAFWPNPEKPLAATQLLLRYADWVRVHTVTENSDVEIVAGLFVSAPAEKAPRDLHTLWIEPVTANLVTELPFEAPGPHSLHLKVLPSVAEPPRPKPAPAAGTAQPPASQGSPASRIHETSDEGSKLKERFIFEAAVKIRELKKLLGERDERIRELRSGGVGTARPLAPPDAESLLEAFQERYFEARFQIRQFEVQIAEMERKGASPREVEALRQKMAALAAREKEWIRTIATTLETHKAAKG